MWANTTVTYPWLTCRKTNSRNNDTPVMISGLSIGILFRKVSACLPLPLILCIPIAATVPRNVDTVAAMRAMRSVFSIADIREPVPCISPVKRLL